MWDASQAADLMGLSLPDVALGGRQVEGGRQVSRCQRGGRIVGSKIHCLRQLARVCGDRTRVLRPANPPREPTAEHQEVPPPPAVQQRSGGGEKCASWSAEASFGRRLMTGAW